MDPRTVSANGSARAVATVDGEELFFESNELTPVASPELFASALLPVAAATGVRLVVDSPLDPTWLANVEIVLRTWASWWGTEASPGRLLEGPIDRSPSSSPTSEPHTGLCFTLGVDSFHTLLRSGRPVDRLVFGEGYDVPLGDQRRMRAIRDGLEEVAGRTGTEAVVISTNLREHHVGRRIDWERGHGGPLAALGHACGSRLGELLISSTKPLFANRPWGSHWETDPGWSSSRLRVTHVGEERRRNEKLAALLGEPLVQRHLRVCWENRAPAGNCGECEKCVRTMLILAVNGRLADFETFPQDGPLAARLDAVPRIPPDSIPVYEEALKATRDRAVRAAVARLIERSSVRRRSWLRRAVSRLRAPANR